MPHRFLSLEEVAEYLHLDQVEVKKLVRANEIPHENMGNRLSFRRIDIDAWASQRLLGMKADDVKQFHHASSAKQHDLSMSHALLPELMKDSYIEHDLQVRTKNSAIRGMVELADSTGLLIYKEDLRDGIEERERMNSTALAGGIALLHPPHHDPYMFEDTFIVLGRAPKRIPFGAIDGQMTDLFFLICSQDDRIHLHLLARLSMICHHTSLLLELREAETREGMFEAILSAESEVIEKHTKRK